MCPDSLELSTDAVDLEIADDFIHQGFFTSRTLHVSCHHHRYSRLHSMVPIIWLDWNEEQV